MVAISVVHGEFGCGADVGARGSDVQAERARFGIPTLAALVVEGQVGSLFRGKWYNIKQLIGMAKEAKLKPCKSRITTFCSQSTR